MTNDKLIEEMAVALSTAKANGLDNVGQAQAALAVVLGKLQGDECAEAIYFAAMDGSISLNPAKVADDLERVHKAIAEHLGGVK